MLDHIKESVDFLKTKISETPRVGIILGTGMSSIEDQMEIEKTIPYLLIPHFAATTVQGHRGKLILGKIQNVPVVILSGRFHYYEGFNMEEVTYPVRVLKFLGIQQLIVTNASGSINPNFHAGDIVCIKDHINFLPINPLRGKHEPAFGPRFPDMSKAYNSELLNKAEQACDSLSIPFKQGIYFGWQGPSLETPAEYRMIKLLGADLVGMSTIPEVICAKQMSLPVLAISVVSNDFKETDDAVDTTIEEVIRVVESAAQKVGSVISAVLGNRD